MTSFVLVYKKSNFYRWHIPVYLGKYTKIANKIIITQYSINYHFSCLKLTPINYFLTVKTVSPIEFSKISSFTVLILIYFCSCHSLA